MADMVPDEIEPAEGVGGAPHNAAGEVVLAQIADQTQCAAAGGSDFADHGIDPRLVEVDDPDSRTLAGEAQGTGPPHPGSRRRDGADFAVEPHGFLLSRPRPRCPWSHKARRARYRRPRGSHGA